MFSDSQAAKNALPADLLEDVELAILVQRCFGVSTGVGMSGAAMLVAEYRRRQEAAANG